MRTQDPELDWGGQGRDLGAQGPELGGRRYAAGSWGRRPRTGGQGQGWGYMAGTGAHGGAPRLPNACFVETSCQSRRGARAAPRLCAPARAARGAGRPRLCPGADRQLPGPPPPPPAPGLARFLRPLPRPAPARPGPRFLRAGPCAPPAARPAAAPIV